MTLEYKILRNEVEVGIIPPTGRLTYTIYNNIHKLEISNCFLYKEELSKVILDEKNKHLETLSFDIELQLIDEKGKLVLVRYKNCKISCKNCNLNSQGIFILKNIETETTDVYKNKKYVS